MRGAFEMEFFELEDRRAPSEALIEHRLQQIDSFMGRIPFRSVLGRWRSSRRLA